LKQLLQELQNQLKGTLFFDDLHKTIYATDASVYRKIPLAVAYPSNNQDIQQLVHFAQKNAIFLNPKNSRNITSWAVCG
jgi:FAD/FMN-containing dehydrogenase